LKEINLETWKELTMIYFVCSFITAIAGNCFSNVQIDNTETRRTDQMGDDNFFSNGNWRALVYLRVQ
jgi:hypothetical protein